MNRFLTPDRSLFRRWTVLAALAAALLAVGARPVRADEITRRLQEELRRRNLYFGDVGRPYQHAARRRAASLPGTQRIFLHRRGGRRHAFFPQHPCGRAKPRCRAWRSPPAPARQIHRPPPRPLRPPRPLPARRPGRRASWPDITVLRSDEARPAPPPGDAEAAAARAEARLAGEPHVAAVSSPTPAPPPAASGMIRRPTVEQVRDYLARYLEAGQKN